MTIKDNKKGFSLIEVTISIFIFVLMMATVSDIFVNFIAAYRSAKAIQRDLENAQYAMNLMAKNLRTSTVVFVSGNLSRIKFYNYSNDGKCINYRFKSNELQVASANDPGDSVPDKKTWCQGINPVDDDYSDLTSISSVYLKDVVFYSIFSDGTSNPKKVGKVTILVEMCSDATCKDKANIQTSVSLRDYQEVGL